jgi:hypothetical protein
MRPHLVFLMLFPAACAPAATSASGSSGQPDRVIAVDDRVGTSIRTPNDVEATRITLNATADEVFNAVTASYAFLKIPVTYADKNIGEQGNKKYVMSRTFDHQPISAYLNCGDDPFAGPNANANPVTVSIVTRARAAGGTGTILETTFTGVTFKATASTGPIYCATTGTLEKHIADMVSSRVPKSQ